MLTCELHSASDVVGGIEWVIYGIFGSCESDVKTSLTRVDVYTEHVILSAHKNGDILVNGK